MNTTQHKTIYRKDYTVPPYLIDEVLLDFQLKENGCVLTAQSTIFRNPKSDESLGELFLDGENLELLEILIDEKKLGKQQYRIEKNGDRKSVV